MEKKRSFPPELAGKMSTWHIYGWWITVEKGWYYPNMVSALEIEGKWIDGEYQVTVDFDFKFNR